MGRIHGWSSHTRRRFGETVPKHSLPEEDAALLSDAMTSMLGVEVEHYWCPTCDGWHVGRKSTSDRTRVRPFLPQSEQVLLEMGERVLRALPLENSANLSLAKRVRYLRKLVFRAQWKKAEATMTADGFRAYIESQQPPTKARRQRDQTSGRGDRRPDAAGATRPSMRDEVKKIPNLPPVTT